MRTNKAKETQTNGGRLEGLGNRSIARILERGRARRNRRSFCRAPDFLHGDCRVDAPYETFGAEWVESTGFVERIVDADGQTMGWTVGTYEDGFLNLEHAARADVADIEAWLADQLRSCERVVALDLVGREQMRSLPGVERIIPVDSSQSRLHALEQAHLKVTRDRDFGQMATPTEAMNERFLQSRLNVMTLACLCAKLVAPTR